MRNILLLSDAPNAALLRAAFGRVGDQVIGEVSTPAALQESVQALAPDVVVVATDTPADGMFDALSALSESSPRPVVMFAKDPRADLIRRSVECGVNAYVVDGWSPERLTAIIEAAIARFEAYIAVKKELARTRDKLSERKVIEKAKGLVMHQGGVTEDQAYGALRKMAMDQSLPLAEVARRVIAAAQVPS